MSEWWQVVEPDILRIIIRAFVGMMISFVLFDVECLSPSRIKSEFYMIWPIFGHGIFGLCIDCADSVPICRM